MIEPIYRNEILNSKNFMMEQLTFKLLLTRFGFDDILPDFKALYQSNQPRQAQYAN